MARIRSNGVRGELGHYEYEVHYVANQKIFQAKKYPPELEAFIERSRIWGASEEALEIEFRKVVDRYEKTLDNWTLYIVYKFSYSNGNVPQLSRNGYGHFRKSLSIDYEVVYYNDAGGKDYYITRDAWEAAEKYKAAKTPQSVYGDYDIRDGRSVKRIEHTPELEQFFSTICNSMSTLIDKVISVLEQPEEIKMLASSQIKLIG